MKEDKEDLANMKSIIQRTRRTEMQVKAEESRAQRKDIKVK